MTRATFASLNLTGIGTGDARRTLRDIRNNSILR